MSTPSVPPRPQRTQAGHTAVKNETPSIPPRPSRKADPSPDGRSPLNGPPISMSSRPARPSSARNSEELPRRPPSVTLPDVGQEGAEYSSFDLLPAEAHGVKVAQPGTSASEQTKSVSADLHLHQPKASVPQSTARKQIQNVTGTDSTQAAAAGIGRARPADDVHKMPPGDARTESPLSRVTSNTNETKRSASTEPANALRAKASFNRSTPSLHPLERTSSRPGSVHGDDREHGIPEIGVQVPLLAMAGDVQAPTPQPGATQHAPGIGFFNDGSSRAHHRKRSSRHEFGPPDSYGIRHDQDHQDQFEKEWARKHPREAAREEFHTHLPKPETALSSEQLNRIVHAVAPGPAATPGTPDEHEAEEYLSRVSSAAPSPALGDRKKRASSGSQTKPESPLRKTSFPFNDKNRLHPDDALEDEPSPFSRGGNSYMGDDHEHEHADGTPILAADELMKRPSSAFMHAAVTPDPDSHYDEYYDSDTARNSRRSSMQPPSRPSSRPNSVHANSSMQGYSGGSLHRFISHEEQLHSGIGTPLEEIEEYEPLFPEDENAQSSPKKVFKKRPELAQHHFPSRDVWEDTPASLQYSATVSTPELEKTQQQSSLDIDSSSTAKSNFETPDQEKQRRSQNDRENDMTSDNKTFMKPQFKSDVAEEMHRPGAHRFPSSDVWEDSPDSVRLVTTVSSPQMDEAKSPPDDRPSTYALPGSQDDDAARATTGFSQSIRPSVPARPARSSKLTEEVKPSDAERVRSPPSIPEKPKVPARPARPSKATDAAAPEDVVAAVKAKPPVPARPGGEKIAALKAGFMNDLNNRLKLGPQGPPPKKEPEAEPAEEEEKVPLADARKSRAKGPARRKPAASPAHDRKLSVTFAMSPLIHVWSIDEEDELRVHEKEAAKAAAMEMQEAETLLAENGAKGTESAAPPADEVAVEEVATKISNSDEPGVTARQHRSSEAELKAALAAAGAAPSSYAETETIKDDTQSREETLTAAQRGSSAKDTAVQTGETEMTTTLPSGEQETTTALLGAKAPEAGDVIVKDGKEVQS